MARRGSKTWFDEFYEEALTPNLSQNAIPRGRHDPTVIHGMEITPYERYVLYMHEAKAKGWLFKEGAQDIMDRNNFAATANMYKAMVSGIDKPAEQVIFEEQLKTQNESIAQAVMLWNQNPRLVALGGEMTEQKFRDNESDAFALLRSQYPSKKEYDKAMSY